MTNRGDSPSPETHGTHAHSCSPWEEVFATSLIGSATAAKFLGFPIEPVQVLARLICASNKQQGETIMLKKLAFVLSMAGLLVGCDQGTGTGGTGSSGTSGTSGSSGSSGYNSTRSSTNTTDSSQGSSTTTTTGSQSTTPGSSTSTNSGTSGNP